MSYKPTIGLEIHVELKTATKMFCRCQNNPEENKPNVNICPVCTAQPGALPVINKEAVRHVLRVGSAVEGTIADFTEFDRKNYFYPDIPKGYQISQYKYPLISGGNLNGVELTRIHLEEDTAKSSHESDHSLIDFNRSSLPLMELVTEPVIHNGKTASAFAKELQTLMRYLGASEANMEKGQMRIEANISVAQTDVLGTKVEVKNLNSFKSVEKAIDFEIDRQIKALEKGEKIVQETRG
ncbi:MAG: Asp-tRNA(Asn)/Glu-tRNA(Gln) amidotransferase subunit GatB, partial [Candidatus Vogelbacteria bacterium]|nr:Asp-tRNA(Asn)/Glu-tRNA(Gln) amidotransferase subunit GatB [Candidatus Vogelbacteria bacterium]